MASTSGIMATNVNQPWSLEKTATTKHYEYTIGTENKYLDRNIKVNITAQKGEYDAAINFTTQNTSFTPTISRVVGAGKAGGTSVTSSATTTEPPSGYYIAVQSSAGSNPITVEASAKISQSGWLNTTDTTSAKSANVKLNASSITYLPIDLATFQNIESTTEDSFVPIITKAGYTPIKTIKSITVPVGESSTKKRKLTVNTNNNTETYMYGSGAVYFGNNGTAYTGTAYIGNQTTGTGTDKKIGKISTITLLGYSGSTTAQYCDTITNLNIGSSTTNKGAQISTITNYSRIDTLHLNGGWINHLYGTGFVTTSAGKTLSTYNLAAADGATTGGTLTTLSLNAGTTSTRGGRINTLDMKAYSEIGTLSNAGTISTLNGAGTITTDAGTGTITTKTGSRTITNLGNSTTAGTLNITTNTYGTINVWGGKTKDKGVTIANHIVTVDGDGTNAGTAVTNSNGDLIIGSVTFNNTTLSVSPSVTPTATASATASGLTLGSKTTSAPVGVYIKATGGNTSTTGSPATGDSCTVTKTTGWISGGTNSIYSVATASASANSTNAYYQVTKVTVPKDTAFTVETAADTALDSTSNLTITNNNYRQVAITNNTYGDVNITGAGRTDFTVGSTTTGTLYGTAYIDNGTTTSSGSQQIIVNGKWYYHSVSPSANAQGPFYGETKVSAVSAATAQAICGNASFSNTATSGVTYTDYSSSAPILLTNDFLYINAGYTPARKISLAKLVPDEYKVNNNIIPFSGASQMLTGYMAWDKDGKAITGTMPNKGHGQTLSNGRLSTSQNDTYVFDLPYGYYPKQTSIDYSYVYVPGDLFRSTMGNAVFTNVTATTTNQDASTSAYIPLVTSAGYTNKQWIRDLTIPAQKTLDTIQIAGASTSNIGGRINKIILGESSLNADGTSGYRGGAITSITMNKGAEYTGGTSSTYISTIQMDRRSFVGNIYTLDATGCTVAFGSDSHTVARTYPTICIGSSTSSGRTTYAQGNLIIRGRNTEPGYEDRINILNIGESTTNKYGRVTTINNYGTIGLIQQTGGIIGNIKGDQTINNVEGTLRIGNNAVNGTITVNAYNDASTPALTGAKTIVSGGKWSKTTLNYASATGNYYGWISFTKPTAANLASGNIEIKAKTGTSVVGYSTASVQSGSATTPATTITANPSLSTTKETNGYKMSVSATQSVTPTVSAGWVASGTAGTITVSGSAYISAAAGSVTMAAGNGTVSAKSNVEFWDTDNGIQVGGKGTVSATAKITTAGYTPINNSFATGSSTSSNEATKYIRGVTLAAPTTPGEERTFYIQVPNGNTNDYIKFTFKVDSTGNVWVE